MPSWVGIPTSVALPFGVFEKVLSDDLNKVSSSKAYIYMHWLSKFTFSFLPRITYLLPYFTSAHVFLSFFNLFWFFGQARFCLMLLKVASRYRNSSVSLVGCYSIIILVMHA